MESLEGPSNSSNQIKIPETFPSRDPLGLNDLVQPTYSYSLDDGLHNFTIPISTSNPTSTASSAPYVVTGQSFSITPSISLNNGSNTKKSFRLVPYATSKNYVKTPTTLSTVDKKAYEEENKSTAYECEWDDCTEKYVKFDDFVKHVSEHVDDIPIISKRVLQSKSSEDTEQKTLGNNHTTWKFCRFLRHIDFT